MSEFFAVTAAAAARILFAIHGIAAIWRVALVYRKNKYWFQAITLFGIPAEFFVTLYVNNGHEWKWFCPSVFFYLCTVIPSVWFLELDLAEQRSRYNVTQLITSTDNEDYVPLVPWKIPAEMWTQIVEQTLLLVLIIGRWLLPVGKTMTRDQLSQLLLVYIGTAADIIELFEAFKESGVQRNLTIIHLILSAWSVSLLQFTLVVTSTKSRKTRGGFQSSDDSTDQCFTFRLFWETELWALSTTILLQDGPFLCLRLGLIIHYKIISQSNVFFTTKNFLVVLLQLYRVCVIVIEHRKRQRLARLAGLNPNHHGLNELLQLPIMPEHQTIKRTKKKLSTMSNNSLNILGNGKISQSTTSMHIRSPTTDPLPRKKRSPSSTSNTTSVSKSKHLIKNYNTLPINNKNISSSYSEIDHEVLARKLCTAV
ncbi:unnamed protein product [Didymodactylos carnosus]|nr:unnamed protein product [Didymodactylos carnosus]CAF3556947.1 unnamed protein product [Didymodactylos carnosus]